MHGMFAWILAFLILKNVNDRRLAVICGVALDIDGVFIFFSSELYYGFHHTFTHSFVFGIPIAIVAGILATEKTKVFFTGLGAFTLHIFADIIGSDWPVLMFYPISDFGLSLGDYLSDFMIYVIINPVAFFILLVVIIYIAFKKEQSPFEFISEKFDKKIIGLFIYPFKYKCSCNHCGNRAALMCSVCGARICYEHGFGFFATKCPKCL